MSLLVPDAVEALLVSVHKLTAVIGGTGEFQDLGMSFGHFLILRTLAAGGESPVGRLAASTRLSRQRINSLVPAMIDDGLLRMRIPDEDARMRLLMLAPGGIIALAALRKSIADVSTLGGPRVNARAVLRASRIADRLNERGRRLGGGDAVPERPEGGGGCRKRRDTGPKRARGALR